MKTVFRRVVVITVAVILYAGLATRFLREERCLQVLVFGHTILDDKSRSFGHRRLKAAVYHKRPTTRMRR